MKAHAQALSVRFGNERSQERAAEALVPEGLEQGNIHHAHIGGGPVQQEASDRLSVQDHDPVTGSRVGLGVGLLLRLVLQSQEFFPVGLGPAAERVLVPPRVAVESQQKRFVAVFGRS